MGLLTIALLDRKYSIPFLIGFVKVTRFYDIGIKLMIHKKGFQLGSFRQQLNYFLF
jgi:hypothetical protein